MIRKKRILLVDDLAIFREPIAIALQSEGYKVATARDGKHALDVVEKTVEPFDLLILDFSMPELDGLSFLSKARGYSHVSKAPCILLTEVADKDVVLHAAKLGVNDYMLKSNFSMSGLIEKVRKNLNKTPTSPIIESVTPLPSTNQERNTLEELREFIRSHPLPKSVQTFLSQAEEDNPGLDELSKAIETEPVLSTKLIKLANSSAYAGSGPRIDSVSNALAKVGLSAVIGMATNLHFHDMKNKENEIWLHQLSRHTLSVATIMQKLRSNQGQSSSSFFSGICHNLTEIFLATRFPKLYKIALSESAGDKKLFVTTVEKHMRSSYKTVVKAVYKELLIPESLSAPIINYHKSSKASQSTHELESSLYIANEYSKSLELCAPSDTLISSEKIPTNYLFGKKLDSWTTSLDDLKTRIVESYSVVSESIVDTDRVSSKRRDLNIVHTTESHSSFDIWLYSNFNINTVDLQESKDKLSTLSHLIISNTDNQTSQVVTVTELPIVKAALELKIPLIVTRNADQTIKGMNDPRLSILRLPETVLKLNEYVARID